MTPVQRVSRPAAGVEPRVPETSRPTEAKPFAPELEHPAIDPMHDPKAERAREHMKKMRGVESQRNEEHHEMTRHKKNQ